MKILATLSPNLMVGLLCLAASLGFGLMVLGYFTNNAQLILVGKWLVMPLLLGGLMLLIVVIPYLFWKNRKN